MVKRIYIISIEVFEVDYNDTYDYIEYTRIHTETMAFNNVKDIEYIKAYFKDTFKHHYIDFEVCEIYTNKNVKNGHSYAWEWQHTHQVKQQYNNNMGVVYG